MNDADNDSGTNTGKARERVVPKQNLDLPLDLKISADLEPISGVLTRAYIAALGSFIDSPVSGSSVSDAVNSGTGR